MAELGVNVAGRAEYKAQDIAAIGATWARCVAYPDKNISGWIQACHDRGIRVLLILGSESIGQDPAGWLDGIDHFAHLYLGQVDAWQIGNEPDGVGESSWIMSKAGLNHLIHLARKQLGERTLLVGPGLVSGQPSWLQGVDINTLDAIACHPYAKWPGTPDLDYMLQGYADWGMPLWVTEYHARTIGMAPALRDDPRLDNVMAFCYSDEMVSGFGLIENPAALADYMAASGETGSPVPPRPTPPPEPTPAPPQPIYVLGFADFYAAAPELLGKPLETERGGIPGLSFQATERGFLTAAFIQDPEDFASVPCKWHLTFYESSTRYRYELQGSDVVRLP